MVVFATIDNLFRKIVTAEYRQVSESHYTNEAGQDKNEQGCICGSVQTQLDVSLCI